MPKDVKSKKIRIERAENGWIVTTQEEWVKRYIFPTHRELVTFMMAYVAGLEDEGDPE